MISGDLNFKSRYSYVCFIILLPFKQLIVSLTLLYEGGGPGGKTGSNLENQQYFENCAIFKSKKSQTVVPVDWNE